MNLRPLVPQVLADRNISNTYVSVDNIKVNSYEEVENTCPKTSGLTGVIVLITYQFEDNFKDETAVLSFFLQRILL